MAGQPKRRAMIAELERRTREELGLLHTHLDYADHWISSGHTMQQLADQTGVARETLRRYLIELDPENAESRLAHARARGAHALVDHAADAFEDIKVEEPRDALTLAKSKSDMQLRVAAMWNQREFGQKAQANVSITFNALHMDALRHRPTATVAVEDLPAIPGAIEPDYEVVSDDTATT